MKKFQYLVVEELYFLSQEELNEYGSQSWELVSEISFREVGQRIEKIRYTFKRRNFTRRK